MEHLSFKCQALETELAGLTLADYILESRYTKTDSLNYNLSIVQATWGIFSIHISVPDQLVSMKIEVLKKGSDEPELYDLELQLYDVNYNPDINHKSLSDSIIPKTLELELEDLTLSDQYKTIKGKAKGTLSFQ